MSYFYKKKNRLNILIKKPKITRKKGKREKSKIQLSAEKNLDKNKSMSFMENFFHYSSNNSNRSFSNNKKHKNYYKKYSISSKKYKEDKYYNNIFKKEKFIKIKNKLFKKRIKNNNKYLNKNDKIYNKIKQKKYSYNILKKQVACIFIIKKQRVKNKIYCLNGKSIYFCSENLKKINNNKKI